jgi:hypothetical protein
LRGLTAAAVICICFMSVLWGTEVVRFSAARARSEPLDRWRAIPGLTSVVLEAEIFDPKEELRIPLPAKEGQLVAAIAAHPMSSREWLMLAETRFAAGRAAADVDAAVTMSQLTGPNEGALMWQRGLFAIVRWNGLSSDARRLAISDLATAIHAGVTNEQSTRFAAALIAQEPPETRAAIADGLATAGLLPIELARLGLHTGAY